MYSEKSIPKFDIKLIFLISRFFILFGVNLVFYEIFKIEIKKSFVT